jgi:transposase
MKRGVRYPVEVRERAMRMVAEHRKDYQSEWAAITSVSEKLGMKAETLRKWIRQAEVDGGSRPGVSTAEAERIKELERENRELRRANEILKAASVLSIRERDTSVFVGGRRRSGVESAQRLFGGRAARAVGALAAGGVDQRNRTGA